MSKTSLILAVVLALIGMGLTSCTEAPPEPQRAALLADGVPDNWMLGTNVIQSVSGNGHLVDAQVDRTVTFNIHTHADGTVEGWYHSVARGPGGAHTRVSVECLHVVGNQAWATGTIVAAANPDNVGRPYSVRFVDNGERAGAEADEIGVERFADYDCTTEPDIQLRRLTMGNLQVRG